MSSAWMCDAMAKNLSNMVRELGVKRVFSCPSKHAAWVLIFWQNIDRAKLNIRGQSWAMEKIVVFLRQASLLCSLPLPPAGNGTLVGRLFPSLNPWSRGRRTPDTFIVTFRRIFYVCRRRALCLNKFRNYCIYQCYFYAHRNRHWRLNTPWNKFGIGGIARFEHATKVLNEGWPYLSFCLTTPPSASYTPQKICILASRKSCKEEGFLQQDFLPTSGKQWPFSKRLRSGRGRKKSPHFWWRMAWN